MLQGCLLITSTANVEKVIKKSNGWLFTVRNQQAHSFILQVLHINDSLVNRKVHFSFIFLKIKFPTIMHSWIRFYNNATSVVTGGVSKCSLLCFLRVFCSDGHIYDSAWSAWNRWFL